MANLKQTRVYRDMILSDYHGDNLREERMFDMIVRLVAEVDGLNRRIDDPNQGRVQ